MEFDTSDEIIEEVLGQWITSHTSPNFIGSNIFFDNFDQSNSPKSDQVSNIFFTNLDRFSDNLQPEIREPLFLEIVCEFWEKFRFDYFILSKVLTVLDGVDKKTLKRVLKPLSNIALKKDISPSELQTVFQTLNQNSKFWQTKLKIEYNVIIASILRDVFYNQMDFFSSEKPEIKDILIFVKELKDSGDDFWKTFFIDLYYRHKCNYLTLHNNILLICEDVFNESKMEANNPLVQLKDFILTPLEIAKIFDEQTVISN